MSEFPVAWCPGPECMSKVRIWPQGVNMCCQNCWAWSAYWSGLNGDIGAPADGTGGALPYHSERCDERQAVRADWEVTEGTYPLVTADPPGREGSRRGRSTR